MCMGKSKTLAVERDVKQQINRNQNDICRGKRQKDMCPFRYWRAREGNSDYTGKFHQSPETEKKCDL